MPFHYIRPSDALQRALRVAVASHRPVTLRAVLAPYGNRAFAKALVNLSNRIIADMLSMLPASERAGVLNRLPHATCKRLRKAEGSGMRDSLCARTTTLSTASRTEKSLSR
jgi:hypothetical protein